MCLTAGAGRSRPAGGAAALEALAGLQAAPSVQTRVGQAGVVRYGEREGSNERRLGVRSRKTPGRDGRLTSGLFGFFTVRRSADTPPLSEGDVF